VAISGRGTPIPPDIQYLIDNKVDLFITGENSEWIREIFREVGIHFIAGGHYHTERFGILNLEKVLKEKLPVETEFLELVNNV
jgi:putative NIF3 family GTP cyclohydrolase 1 type 2